MINKLMKNESGQGMTEYVIILVSIAVVCIAIAVQFGGHIKGLFETADTEIDTVDANMQAETMGFAFAMLALCVVCAYVLIESRRGQHREMRRILY